ncbi:RNA methyltransferase [Georgenia sp. TF02-10]|uniref:TrmH family RNA methyltransferase n=1 Tax=Georgenia sp. TF02-10 TaxID=2917725 RepID=UPI001FA6F803|nr:RNA methyltransferase [Georgenia sp. TF02-10]UNX56009.1 RNA methyltransferase [Georgenia sp. TF02-10]
MTERPDTPQLTNPRAERVRKVRGLSGRSARQRHRLFLVEGPQAVRELLRHAPDQVRDLYLTPAAADRHREIPDAARAARRHVHLGTADVLAAMSPDAQGVLAVAHLPAPVTLAELPAPRLVAVLAQVSDPGNAGTVIRAADAAGADAVVLTAGSVEPTNPKVVRATAGSLFHLPVVTGVDLATAASQLRAAGLTLLAADAGGEWDLDELADRAAARAAGYPPQVPGELAATAALAPDLTAPTGWVFGNEAHGLADAERDLADAVVAVPLHGRAESLNLAAAATVCLYASARAQRRAG